MSGTQRVETWVDEVAGLTQPNKVAWADGSKAEYDRRQAGTWDEAGEEVVQTICPYCGVGCNLELHVQGGDIVNVTSPADHDVTQGNLCVKGRFGFQFVQNR